MNTSDLLETAQNLIDDGEDLSVEYDNWSEGERIIINKYINSSINFAKDVKSYIKQFKELLES